MSVPLRSFANSLPSSCVAFPHLFCYKTFRGWFTCYLSCKIFPDAPSRRTLTLFETLCAVSHSHPVSVIRLHPHLLPVGSGYPAHLGNPGAQLTTPAPRNLVSKLQRDDQGWKRSLAHHVSLCPCAIFPTEVCLFCVQ